MYHYRDNFYERYVPTNIGTNNTNTRSQNRESEIPPVSRFDWTSSESDDGRGRNERRRGSKKRWENLKESLKNQKAKAVRSIKSAGDFLKGVRGRRSG